MMSEPLLVSMTEAAQLLSVSRPTLYAWAKLDGFPVIRLGGCVRVSVEGLRRWIEQQSTSEVG